MKLRTHVEDLHAGNVAGFIEDVDLVIDGTDNFETRYLLNDACLSLNKPWIYGACVASYGMSFVIRPGKTACLRCFMEEEPAPGTSPSCDTAGVIAPIVHAVAAFQVTEALKLLAGRESDLRGEVLSIDIWQGRLDRFRPKAPREDCPACGARRWEYLSGEIGSRTAKLCGRNAVQVRPGSAEPVELGALGERLSHLGEVRANAHLLRFKFEDREIVLFRDGRAIIHGTEDPAEARSLYARFIGS